MINKRQVLYGFRDCILPFLKALFLLRNTKDSNTVKVHHACFGLAGMFEKILAIHSHT